ncbi:MAG: hypothetical protein CL916_09130 [Deltaproteobacteria bacterium]|nr:hypothetical protein [Deltaproteobacteria bacterium]
MQKTHHSFIMKMEERLSSIDAPLLLPISPNLPNSENAAEEIVIRAHLALEETYDIIAGVIIDTASFFSYGSLGIASLEAIFEMLHELDIPIITDTPGCFSSNGARAIHKNFCLPESPMFSHALRFFGINPIEKQWFNNYNSTIFLSDGCDFIYTSDSNARNLYPDAFLLFDGESTNQLRRSDGTGVLHVARLMDTVMWEEQKDGIIRESFIQCAKDFLSLP